MDRAQTQNTLKALCKVMWDNNVTNPITYVTQISYLLFLKMLEEMDHEQQEAQNGNYRSLFGKFKDGKEVRLHTVTQAIESGLANCTEDRIEIRSHSSTH